MTILADPAPLDRPATLPDEEVVARVCAGERALFEVLMRRYNQRLFRAARAIVKDDAEAEDVMQEAYVRAYTHLGELADRARFGTWLTRIAVREALARLRRRRETAVDGAFLEDAMDDATVFPAPASDPEQGAADRELGRALEAAVDALPEPFRVVFVLRAVEDLSVADTAACLEIPEETVKTRLHRARARLQQALLTQAAAALPEVHAFHRERCDRVVAAVLRRIAADAR